MRADPWGLFPLGAHKYGRYLHILTPVGSSKAHDEQPWEGITGRVKQETNRLMVEMASRTDANQEAIKSVEAKLEAQQSKLESIERQLSAVLDHLMN